MNTKNIIKALVAVSVASVSSWFVMNTGVYTESYFQKKHLNVSLVDKNYGMKLGAAKVVFYDISKFSVIERMWAQTIDKKRIEFETENFLTINCSEEIQKPSSVRYRKRKSVFFDMPNDEIVVIAVCYPEPEYYLETGLVRFYVNH